MAEVRGYAQLQARLHAVGGTGSSSLMNQIGLAVVRESKLLVPRKTGNLGRSIRVIDHTATQVTVAATANYAAFVELGTRPHTITPKAAKALAWSTTAAGSRLSGSIRKGLKVGSLGLGRRGGGLGGLSISLVGSAGPSSGAIQFAKVVHHPGTRPEPFLLPGAKLAVSKVGAQAVVDAWNGAA